MKILDNRYKIEENIYNDFFVETYRVRDIWKNDQRKFLKIYHYNLQKELIEYFIANQINIQNIIHKNIVHSERFSLLMSIDTKDTNKAMYYSVSEYIEHKTLRDELENIGFKERLDILLDVILALNFLHFRGFTYKFLNPMQILLTKDRKVKLQSVANVIEKDFLDDYNEFEKRFLSPEYIAKNIDEDKFLDYYSLGELIKYLFLEDDRVLESASERHSKEELVGFFNKIIRKLESRDFKLIPINLMEIADKIVEFFDLDYEYDLVEERNKLFLNNPLIGRDKEIRELLALDEKVYNKMNYQNLVTIDGSFGLGKTRFLKEAKHRLDLRNNKVYSVDLSSKSKTNNFDVAPLLRQSMTDASSQLKEKYLEEFAYILPELNIISAETQDVDLTSMAKKYRLFNRITKYFKELAALRTTYILLDNIQDSNEDFLKLLDYLINNLQESNIVFVLTYDEVEIKKKGRLQSTIDKWRENMNPLEIKLQSLNQENTAELIRSILGMGIAPRRFSEAIYKESQGNPKKVKDILSYIYNDGQLYMYKNGNWRMNKSDYSDIYIPGNMDEELISDLKALENHYKDILVTISVFDDLVPKAILAKIIDENKDSLDKHLDELIDKKLILEDIGDWGHNYRINGTELKKFIYFETDGDKIKEMHRKAAEVMGEMDAKLYDSMLKDLIYHLIKSDQRKKSLSVLKDRFYSLEDRNGSQALQVLEAAYDVYNEDTENYIKLGILEKLIEIEIIKGLIDEEDEFLKEYRELSYEAKDSYHILNYKRILANVYFNRRDFRSFKEILQEIYDLNQEYRIPKFDSVYLIAKASYYLETARIEESKKLLKQAEIIAKENKFYNHLGDLYNRLGILSDFSGDYQKSKTYYDKSYKYFRLDRDIMSSVKPINNLGNITRNYLNDTEKAMDYFNTGLEMCRKYGIKKAQIIFLANIGEINQSFYRYDQAIENISEANKLAVELQDKPNIIVCQSILGQLYLAKVEYAKAYESYNYVKSLYQNDEIKDVEVNRSYYDFIGHFYYYLGDWERAKDVLTMARDEFIDPSNKEYYKFQFTILVIDFFENNRFRKRELESFLESYRSTVFVEEYRETVLEVASLSIYIDDYAYSKKMLELDDEIRDKVKLDLLEAYRGLMEVVLSADIKIIGNYIENLEAGIKSLSAPYKAMYITKIGDKFADKESYKESIKLYLEALDNIYKNAVKIKDWDLKLSYIKSRFTDGIKSKLNRVLSKAYGKTIDISKLEEIKSNNDFKKYFDIEDVIEIIGKLEYSEITNLNSYAKVSGINDSQSLLASLKDDYHYNLELILNYIAKQAFATEASIIKTEKDVEKCEVLVSLNPGMDKRDYINEGIFRVAGRTEKGLLINDQIDPNLEKVYRNFLTDDINGVICVPIDISGFELVFDSERRNNGSRYSNVIGYIYLESNRAFNNFTEEILELIDSLMYLLYVNIEINKLRLVSTRDKLTGVYTRKYYEEKFKQLIERAKSDGRVFSVLMLDIDRFKVVNDRYGHRKGDQVLRSIGDTIASTVRSTDIIGRYGGEEFVVILKDTKENQALMVAEKIRKSVENLKVDGINHPITISIGLSIYPNHSRFKEDLVEKADQALYYSKETGRNKTSLWNSKMDNSFNRMDKLAGVVTGSSERDDKNILTLIETVELIAEDSSFEDKAYFLLGTLLNSLEADTATIISFKGEERDYYTRTREEEGFVDTPALNHSIIDRVEKNKKGEFQVDWENLEDFDLKSGIPNWHSIIVLPMIKAGELRGIAYISVYLNHREFDFNCFNLAKNYTNIFAAVF